RDGHSSLEIGQTADSMVLSALTPSKVGQIETVSLLERSLALSMLIALMPLFACVVAAIRMIDKQSALFVQDRVGLNGRVFRIYKFQTMKAGCAEKVIASKADHDPRITRLGRWLRKLNIDEMPQLWNIIRGEMRFVGPRPELPKIVEEYDVRAMRRLACLPGIAGLWQVSPHRNDPIHHHLEYDEAYLASHPTFLDWAIGMQAVLAGFTGK
ncbi:MAG: sugar transferase, partial [Phycisphaerae bacterium]